jgi:hypothetical protein
VNHLYDRADLERDRQAAELLASIAKLRNHRRSAAELAELDAIERRLTWHHGLRKSFEAANKAERDAIPVQERRAAEARREAALHRARRAPGGELTEKVIAEIRANALQQSRQRVFAPLSAPLRAIAHRI